MAFDRFPGFGFGGERRPPPRRITPPGPHDHEDFVIKQQLKAGKLFQQDSCALCLFFEETNTAAFTCDKDGGGRKFYCAKHVKKIPEHNRGHKNYHEFKLFWEMRESEVRENTWALREPQF